MKTRTSIAGLLAVSALSLASIADSGQSTPNHTVTERMEEAAEATDNS